MTVKALFLISPAYSVPTIRISIRSRWSRIAVSLRVPSVRGSALNDGTLMIVKFGSKPCSSATDRFAWTWRPRRSGAAEALEGDRVLDGAGWWIAAIWSPFAPAGRVAPARTHSGGRPAARGSEGSASLADRAEGVGFRSP